MNTDELEAALYWAEQRVLEIQTKLHLGPAMIPIAGSMIVIAPPSRAAPDRRGLRCGRGAG